ncbi:MAG: hypothetical protein ACI9XC_002295 [Gammaproteobacteria bacterium]|jgi:hypothetical protein
MIRPGTLNTILNNAPLVIQGAARLIKMIKERNNFDNDTDIESRDDMPTTLDGLKVEIEKLNSKLDDNSKADVEQIELIEQLAKQNEALAESLKITLKRQLMIAWLAGIALVSSIFALVVIYQ